MKQLIITTAALILIVPATAHAVAIHVHEKVPVHHEAMVGKDVDTGAPVLHEWTTMREIVRVEHVAPVDEDQDGVADSEDGCVFCEPAPAPEPATTYAPESAAESVYAAPAASGTVMCESGGDYSANTGNGYYGGYQFDSSTWDAYGDSSYGEASEAPPAVQDAAAASVPYDAWPNC